MGKVTLRNINRTTLLGSVISEPEITRYEGGARLATFRMRTAEKVYDESEKRWLTLVEHHFIYAWNSLCDEVDGQVHKGMDIFVEGLMRTRKYKGAGGVNMYVVQIHASTIRPFGKMPYKSARLAAMRAEQEEEQEGQNETEDDNTEENDE